MHDGIGPGCWFNCRPWIEPFNPFEWGGLLRQGDFEDVIQFLDEVDGQELSFSYRTGPRGTALVNMTLRRGPGRALTVVMDTPPKATKALDPQTGKLVPEPYRTVTTFRDLDLDGCPKGWPMPKDASA